MGAVLRPAARRRLSQPPGGGSPLRPKGPRGRFAASLGGNPRVAGLPRDFWLLFVGTFINRAGTFVMPFLALYVTRGRGHGEAVAGACLLAFGVAALPSQPVGGTLADGIGRVRTAGGSLLLASVALVALSFARSPLQLILAAGALGLVSDMFRPATSALIADIIPPADRPRAFGLQFWAVNLGFAGAASIGGFLAEISWTLLFVGDAITTATYGIIVLTQVQEPDRSGQAAQPGLLASVGTVARDRLFMGFMAAAFLYAMIYSQTQSTLSLEVVAQGLTPRDYGLILALNGLVIVLVQPAILGRVTTWRPGYALAGAQVVLGVGMGLTAFATNLPTFAATVVIWTLGEIVGATFAAPIVADLSPPEMRGRYQGWFGMSFGVAFAVGPALGVRVFGTYGGDVIWVACAVAGVVSALLVLRIREGLVERREQAALVG